MYTQKHTQAIAKEKIIAKLSLYPKNLNKFLEKENHASHRLVTQLTAFQENV